MDDATVARVLALADDDKKSRHTARQARRPDADAAKNTDRMVALAIEAGIMEPGTQGAASEVEVTA